MRPLEGKIALVTGAGRGIGAAVASALAEAGATVVVTSRTPMELATVVDAIRSGGGCALAIEGDITDEAFQDRLFAEIDRIFSRLDILVNNAGIAPFGPVEELPASDLRRCLELNVVAAYGCMQRAIRLMRDNGAVGKIINIGSVRSHWTEAGDAGAYNASKEGLRAMTQSVARQLHGTGVRIAVGMVNPGVVDTSLTNPSGTPKPDWLKPETVARAVLHAVTAPPDVNVFDTTLFNVSQSPW
ncbi:MAG TPA: SDR family oxidoreductase [Armatimonadota bacterium]|nr:SDR family oxidoreductase [Armatimonadota bacterium]HQK91911.1 SDR family oxidoreductase [Armatimonadota bacterium]